MKNLKELLFLTSLCLLSTTAFTQDRGLLELQREVEKMSNEAIQEIQKYPDLNEFKINKTITARIEQLSKSFKAETDKISANLREELASLDSELAKIQQKCEEGIPSVCEKVLQNTKSNNARKRKELFDIAEAALKVEAEKLFNINKSSDIRTIVFKIENIKSAPKVYYNYMGTRKESKKESQVAQHDIVSIVSRSIFYNVPREQKLPDYWCARPGYIGANLRQIITEDPKTISPNTSNLYFGKRNTTHNDYYCMGEGTKRYYATAEYLETYPEAMKRQGSSLFSQCTDYICTADLGEYYKIWYRAMSSINFNILVSEFSLTLLKINISKSEFDNGIDDMIDLIKSSKD